jgi:integrative and conjugative element protein (TIGR02256 family)
MSPTDGQRSALEQLRDVEAAAGGLFTVDGVAEPAKPGDFLRAEVTLSCAELERAEGGLPLESREQFVILVPPNFPFDKPHALIRHDRFAGFPHVQWKRSLCLYQAPTTEWNPSDGMFGFLDRLYYWLKQGALGQLDPVGAPLHPPVTYLGDGPVRTVIPRVDTPRVGNEPWFGTAHLRVHSDLRVDIVGWSPFLDRNTPQGVGAVILLPTPFPYEFPTNVGNLIAALDQRGVPRERLFLTLQWAAIHNNKDTPLYVIIGTPMRGIRGEELRQHLTAWYVEPIVAWGLKEALGKHAEEEQTREFGEKIERIVLDWAEVAKVAWCAVREDRPEIVTRRDQGSPMGWFAGRTVAVWGCGALGGHAAEYLTRAGVKKLILRDNGIVTPGVLARQPFADADIGSAKAEALRDRLRRIRPDLEVEVSVDSILDVPLGGPDWVAGAEVVIDATASTPVAGLLEQRRWATEVQPVAVISLAIGHDARRGMVVLSLPAHTGGPLDVSRRLKLEACKRDTLSGFLDEFWPTTRRPFFQPEPGCSDATFVGSSADVAALAGLMLNLAAADLAAPPDKAKASGHFVIQPHAAGASGCPVASFAWEPDHVSIDIHAGYQIRISPEAWAGMRSWIVRSRDEAGPQVETGGLLFGERDDAARVIWVSDVSGPPPDSSASAEKFICGVAGTAEMNEEKRGRTRGSVHYLGMWHTHPDSVPLPSPTDWAGMRRLVQAAGGGGRTLMLIIGCPHDTPILGTYVFRARDFKVPYGSVVIRPCLIQVMEWCEQLQQTDTAGLRLPPPPQAAIDVGEPPARAD